MAGIFVSYRRDDSAGHAGRLFDRLREHFGKECVFRDVDQVRIGDDFTKTIADAIGSCDACLVVIGRDWLAARNEAGARRLDDPEDFVRLEVETALSRGVLTVPVLVEGARMVRAVDLPGPLQPLARRQAVELSESRWDFDVAQLVRRLDEVVTRRRWRPRGSVPPALVTAAAVLLLAGSGWFIVEWMRPSVAPGATEVPAAAYRPAGAASPLFGNPGVVYRSPQYSRLGDRIAYQANEGGATEIWVADAEGRNARPLTGFGGGIVGSPRWSPHGDRIAFDARVDEAGGADVWVVPAGGGSAVRLTHDPSDEVRPSWSGDGRWIYFGSNRNGGIWRVWKIPSHGGQARQVTRAEGREAFEAPDGRSVFYARRAAPGIWNVPAEGGTEVRVTDRGSQGAWAVLRHGLLLASLRPDSALELELHSFGTAGCIRLATLPRPRRGGLLELTASPDSGVIAYAVGDTAESEILRAAVRMPGPFELVARGYSVSPGTTNLRYGRYGRYGRYAGSSPYAGRAASARCN